MKGLTDILTSPTVVLVGWALLHFLWQGTAVAAVLAGAMCLLRRRGANVRYAVACVALLVMLAMPPTPLAKCEGETNAQWQSRLTREQKAELRGWRKAHRWHPHQLRHNVATELRKEFGIEGARIILGHHSVAVTEIYAEKDEQQAVEAISKVG